MIIHTENLKKEYEVGTQTVRALRGINLSVEKGILINKKLLY